MHRRTTRRAARGGESSPHLGGPLGMSWAGGPSLGAGKQPNQGVQVCLLQEGPGEG